MAFLFLLFLCSISSASVIPKFGEKLSGNDLVEYLNFQQKSFMAEVSSFTKDEMRARVMDGRFTERIERAPAAKENIMDNVKIPASFDAREKWGNCASIKAIYDQENCGSCWAFCTAETMSDRTCIATQAQVVLSVEDILSCCPNCGYRCNGGYPIKALEYWDSTGVCTGGPEGSQGNCKPYTSGNGWALTCKKECQSGYNITYEQDKHFGSTAYNIPQNVTEIQREIMKNGPVSSTFDVYEDFYHYTGGIYVHTGGSLLGGHCVKTIGWGVENGTPYWIVANSWNTNWGEKGFFRIIRGTNEVNFEANMAAGLL